MRTPPIARWALLVTLTPLAAACAGGDDFDLTAPEQHAGIYDGTLTPEFEATGALIKDGNVFCSGTLIHPWIVLTASHCIDGSEGIITVFFGEDTYEPGYTATVGRQVLHPDWTQGDGAGSPHDIALMRLGEAAPITPVPIRTEGLYSEDFNRDIDLVGFGRHNDSDNDPILRYRRHAPSYVAGYNDAFFAAGSQGSAGGACFGDSGGPAYMESDEGVLEVAGVHHAVGVCGNGTTEVRVDRHANDFILPFVEETDAVLAMIEPEASPEPSPAPEPASEPEPTVRQPPDDGGCDSTQGARGPFGALGLAVLALRRRRRRSALI